MDYRKRDAIRSEVIPFKLGNIFSVDKGSTEKINSKDLSKTRSLMWLVTKKTHWPYQSKNK